MEKWMESTLHVLGSEFDEVLIHSSRIYRVLINASRKRVPRKETGRMREWMSYYLSSDYADHPARFFSFPRKAPRAEVLEEKPFMDGKKRLYAFPSGYKVRNPDFRETFQGFEQNRTAYLYHWLHGDSGRKTILCCHGWSLGDPGQAERMFRIQKLYKMGLDVALFITPFHHRRAASLAERFSPPFPFQHPVLGLEGLGQAMYDLGSSFLLLKQLGASRLGTIGASLGGYLVALFVSLSRMAEVAALVVPLVSFQNLRLPTSILPGGTGNGQGRGTLEKEISALWKIHSPLSLSLKLNPEQCLLIASRGDRLCPFQDVQRLYEHWGSPRHLFLQGGHALFFPRSARGAAWYGFLRDNGFAGSV